MFDINKWLKVFDYKNLEAFFKSEKGKGGISQALIRVLAGFLVYQVPLTIIAILSVLIFGASAMASTYGSDSSGYALLGGLLAGGGTVLVIVLFFISLVLAPIFFIISNGVLHLIAGLLGGKGKFENLLYLASFVTAASYLASLALEILPSLLSLVPSVGDLVAVGLSCLLIPFGIALWLYILYATYKVLMVTYGLSSGRSIATIILGMIFWVLLFVLIALVAFILFGASLASLGMLGGLGSGSSYY
jgi:hypothetical protein